MIHRRIQQIFHYVPGKFPTAISVGGIDFIVAPLNQRSGIPGNGEQRDLFLFGIDSGQHQSVRTAHVVIPLVHAQNHHRSFVRRHQERLIRAIQPRQPARCVKQASGGEECPRPYGSKKSQDH